MEDSGVGLREGLYGTCSELRTLVDVVAADFGPTAVESALVVAAVDILAVHVEDVPETCLCRLMAVLVVFGVWLGGYHRLRTENRLRFVVVDPIHPEGCHHLIAVEMVRYRV